jgi:hypothetical protein
MRNNKTFPTAPGHLGSLAFGLRSWAFGLLRILAPGSWALALSGTRVSGLLCIWAPGQLGTWVLGLLGSWAPGFLGSWASGHQASWSLITTSQLRWDVVKNLYICRQTSSTFQRRPNFLLTKVYGNVRMVF